MNEKLISTSSPVAKSASPPAASPSEAQRLAATILEVLAGVRSPPEAAQLLAIMTASLVATYLELAPMDQLFWLMLGIIATIAPERAQGAPDVGEAARARSAD